MIPALLGAAIALAGPAAAAEPRPPVRVDAAEVHYAFQKREVIFSGSPVTLTREDAVLTCSRLVAKNDEAGQIETAVCQGDVKLVRGDRVVTCDTATYENAAARVTCQGNTVLKDRGSEGRGEKLVYELRADEVKLEGKDGAPVRITVPGSQVDTQRQELEQRRRERKEATR